MNTWVKRTMAAAGISAALAAPMSGLASDGTITFTGAVTASSCTIKINGTGTGDGTVALPTVDTAALTNGAARTTAAGTFFSVGLSACTAATDIGATPVAPTTVQIYFEAGPNVDHVTGGLINTVAGSNVEVNIYNASAASIVGTQVKLVRTPTSPWRRPSVPKARSGSMRDIRLRPVAALRPRLVP